MRFVRKPTRIKWLSRRLRAITACMRADLECCQALVGSMPLHYWQDSIYIARLWYLRMQLGMSLSCAVDTCFAHYCTPQIGKFSPRKKFRRSPSTTEIKPTKYFLPHINGVSLYCLVVIATKIKPGENLTDEIFFRRKIPDLRYLYLMVSSGRLKLLGGPRELSSNARCSEQ